MSLNPSRQVIQDVDDFVADSIVIEQPEFWDKVHGPQIILDLPGVWTTQLHVYAAYRWWAKCHRRRVWPLYLLSRLFRARIPHRKYRSAYVYFATIRKRYRVDGPPAPRPDVQVPIPRIRVQDMQAKALAAQRCAITRERKRLQDAIADYECAAAQMRRELERLKSKKAKVMDQLTGGAVTPARRTAPRIDDVDLVLSRAEQALAVLGVDEGGKDDPQHDADGG